MFPSLALVDPELTLNLPAAQTAATGMDALTQLLEGYISRRSNSFTDALAVEGISHGYEGLCELRDLFAENNGNPSATPSDQWRVAREKMSYAALLSGMVLTNAGLGVVHGFAAPLGGLLGAPHGSICAALLVAGMEMNLSMAKSSSNSVVDKMRNAARLLTGNPKASADDLPAQLKNLACSYRIPKLSEFGLKPNEFMSVVDRAMQTSSMKGNPVELGKNELMTVLERSY
jgi:alcohol dehydrogenase class IV